MRISNAEIERLAVEFDELCNIRMELGQEKYGDFSWLEAPTFDMAIEELADFVNYTRMTAIKMRLMQKYLENVTDEDVSFAPSNSFTPTNPERKQ